MQDGGVQDGGVQDGGVQDGGVQDVCRRRLACLAPAGDRTVGAGESAMRTLGTTIGP